MSDILFFADKRYADIRFQDGGLPHAVGVHSFQVLRANREHPEYADRFGWTYNHAPMLAYYHGRLYCEYLSNPVSEHETPGHTLLTHSENGMDWSVPEVIFPEVEVPTAQYRGPRSSLLAEWMLTVPHQRMGFYCATNDVLLALSFYGLVHDREMSMPCDGWGVGRAVRRIFPTGEVDKGIYFLKYNEVAGYTRENTPVFQPFEQSLDAAFVAACHELLANKPVIQQMYEEQRFDREFLPFKGEQALSYYTVSETEMIGVYKKGLSSVSHDGGKTWGSITENPTIRTATGKVWGQRTADGRFALLYNPTTDGQHRWPIAVVTGEDGHVFRDMLAVTGPMSPLRYGGLDKNLGPQYLRGICEANPQTPDGHVWITYSNNKEDIWVSRVAVPIRSSAEGPCEDDFSAMQDDALPEAWNVYSPIWAPVRMREGALMLCDGDRYDRACAERMMVRSAKGIVEIEACVDTLTEDTRLQIEVQDDGGSVPVLLAFLPDGRLHVRSGGRTEPWTAYDAGKRYRISVEYDCNRSCFTVDFDGKRSAFAYSASVGEVSRVLFATKSPAQLPLSTPETVGKYGTREHVLPGAGEPSRQAQVRILGFWAR